MNSVFSQTEEAELSDKMKYLLIRPEFVRALINDDFTVEDMVATEFEADEQSLDFVAKKILFEKLEFFKAIHDDIFSITDFAQMDEAFIREVLHPTCLEALYSEEVTIDQIMNLSLDELRVANT